MARVRAEGPVEEIEARIVYWGIEGAGKTTNLETIHGKLRPDNRGELQHVPTRLDPTLRYETLAIELGLVRGTKTRLHVVAVPGAPEQAPTRQQLLDQVDGVVLIVDARREQVEANVESFEELKKGLAAYGRSLEDVAVVVQYNKHDLADPYGLEELYRRVQVPGAAVFETVATDPGGVLRTLTTISKRVVRMLREEAPDAAAVPSAPAPSVEALEGRETQIQFDADGDADGSGGTTRDPDEDLEFATPSRSVSATAHETEPELGDPAPELESGEFERPTQIDAVAPVLRTPRPNPTALMEEAILAEGEGRSEIPASDAIDDAQNLLDATWDALEQESKAKTGLRVGADLRIVSVGQATRSGERSVRVPIVLGDGDGATASLALTLCLDPLLDDDG